MSITNPITLCICHRGNVRSGTLAIVLKDFFSQPNVFALGTRTATQDTLAMLGELADTVFIVGTEDMRHELPPSIQAKATLIAVGEDRWMFPMHPELVRELANRMIDMGYKPSGYPSVEVYLAAHEAATRGTIGEWLKS